jgi:hypothetical protein
MGHLFGRERSVITKHIRNVFAEGELDAESNVQNLHTFRLEVRRTSRVKSARRQAYT